MMEGLVLQSLGFHINTPTAHTFLSLMKLGLRLGARAGATASFLTARPCALASMRLHRVGWHNITGCYCALLLGTFGSRFWSLAER